MRLSAVGGLARRKTGRRIDYEDDYENEVGLGVFPPRGGLARADTVDTVDKAVFTEGWCGVEGWQGWP